MRNSISKKITAKSKERRRKAPLLFFPVLQCIILSALLPGSASAVAAIAPDEIRVRILSKYILQEITISGSRGFVFADGAQNKADGKTFRVKAADGFLRLSGGGLTGEGLQAQNIRCSFEGTYIVVYSNSGRPESRTYSGSLDITYIQGALCLVAAVTLEDYITAAARAEAGLLAVGSGQTEFLSAMEIALRSYIIAERNRHISEKYEFCDLTHCAHFSGFLPSGRAESLTSGIIMADQHGKPVRAYFHSTCGGILSGPEVYWSRHEFAADYRRGRDSADGADTVYCARSPHYSWRTLITADKMNIIIGVPAALSSVSAVYKQGRVTSLSYTAVTGQKGIIGISLFLSKAGRALGWNTIKSNSFTITKAEQGWEFSGNGLGHGIGLCQWGAHTLAESGKKAAEILSFYYGDSFTLKRLR